MPNPFFFAGKITESRAFCRAGKRNEKRFSAIWIQLILDKSSMFRWWGDAGSVSRHCFIISAEYIQRNYQIIRIIALFIWIWITRIAIPCLDCFTIFLKS